MPQSVLVIYAHPSQSKSRVNRGLRSAVSGLSGVRIHDLYETYPDYHIDVAFEKEQLLAADVLVFQHPFYWYSCPPLMKAWMDDVLELGFAYGPGGDKLQGKNWMQVISAGGSLEAYRREGGNNFTMRELLRPFEQTAYLCGMKIWEPMVLHAAGHISDAEIAGMGERYRELLENLTAGKFPAPYSTVASAPV